MARPKKTYGGKKKPAQVEVAGQDPGEGSENVADQRNTDGSGENVADTAVASGSGQGGRKSRSQVRSDSESTDSSMDNAIRRLQRRKRQRILSNDEDEEEEEDSERSVPLVKDKKGKGN